MQRRMRATSKGKKEGFVTSQKTTARRSGNRAYKYNHKKKPGKRLEVRFCIKDENRPAVVAVGIAHRKQTSLSAHRTS